MEPITVVVVNYNGEAVLGETLASILAQSRSPAAVILMDDGSTDGSLALVRSRFPGVRVVAMESNTGRANKLRNRGLKEAATDLVFFVDNDIVLDRDSLKILAETLRSDASIAVCTPRLMYYDAPDLINIDSSRFHYIGSSISSGRNRPYDPARTKPEPTAGGGIALIDKRKAETVGGFDEDYTVGWGDDGEIYHRLKLAGCQCLYVPRAFGYHKAKPWGPARIGRAYTQVRNRWLLLLTTYRLRTLVLLMPVLCLYETFLFGFLLVKGVPGVYFRGNWDVLREIPGRLRKRRIFQALRRRRDGEVLGTGDLYVASELIKSRVLRAALSVVNAVFNGYWMLVRRWV